MRTLIASWSQPDEVNAPSLTYIVSYQSTDNILRSSMTGEDELMLTITELLPFTMYSVSVQACSSLECGSSSNLVVGQTLEGGECIII